jgi:hypothetical protein
MELFVMTKTKPVLTAVVSDIVDMNALSSKMLRTILPAEYVEDKATWLEIVCNVIIQNLCSKRRNANSNWIANI